MIEVRSNVQEISFTVGIPAMYQQIDPSKRFERRANLSYDATNQRVRTIDEIEEGSERDFYDEISLFEKVRR